MINTIKFLKIKKVIEENSTIMASDYGELYKINDDYSVDFFVDTYISKAHYEVLSTSLDAMSGHEKNLEKLKSEVAFKCFPFININRCHRSFKCIEFKKHKSLNSKFFFTKQFPIQIDGSLIMEIKHYNTIEGLQYFPKKIKRNIYIQFKIDKIIEYIDVNNDKNKINKAIFEMRTS